MDEHEFVNRRVAHIARGYDCTVAEVNAAL
jgi:hypothetical protein